MQETNLEKDIQQFIDEFGLIVAEGGLPPSIGRVLGLLVISNPPVLSAENIQSQLKLSSGAVSAATSILTKFGYVKRVTVPGQRRYYFEFDAGSWQNALETRLGSVKRGIGLATKGLEISGRDPRLLGMLNMYQQLYDSLKDMQINTNI